LQELFILIKAGRNGPSQDALLPGLKSLVLILKKRPFRGRCCGGGFEVTLLVCGIAQHNLIHQRALVITLLAPNRLGLKQHKVLTAYM
jgi:hypothetical protein